jgi:hypothetical protein
MAINMFCIALSWAAWLDSMALIISVNSLIGSDWEDLLSDATALSLDSDCSEVLHLVKPGRLDFLAALPAFLQPLYYWHWSTF